MKFPSSLGGGLIRIEEEIYSKFNLELSEFEQEAESLEYDACQFKLNERLIISRSAKITPKKIGQFVTFWKRSGQGPIEPFTESDAFDFFVVNVHVQDRGGQFVFPRSILINKGIISTARKEGKRAFRVYPIWDTARSNQAKRTQKWQLDYFYEISDSVILQRVIDLYDTSS